MKSKTPLSPPPFSGPPSPFLPTAGFASQDASPNLSVPALFYSSYSLHISKETDTNNEWLCKIVCLACGVFFPKLFILCWNTADLHNVGIVSGRQQR